MSIVGIGNVSTSKTLNSIYPPRIEVVRYLVLA
jgi:hypothetical protein